MAVSLELPTLQNWSCHSCSGCCRQHEIAISDVEHERIVAQGWTGADGIPAAQPLFERRGGWWRRPLWRLAHQPDGRCVFLDDGGLCRIHAKFGEPAKPLACRIYPYAFHPKGRQVVVSLRFSCPSVVRNRGQAVTEQRRELRELARQVVPENVTRDRPPRLTDHTALDWSDTLRVVQALQTTLADVTAPFPVRLLRGLHWTDLLDAARLDAITGNRFDELLDLLRGAAAAELPADFDLATLPPPSSPGRMLFRLLAGQYARVDSHSSRHRGWSGRWRLLSAAVRLVLGRGSLPALDPRLAPLPFATLEPSFGPLPAEADEILTRYFQVKLAGLSFCGRACYDLPLLPGFRSLVLCVTATLWIARWLAASRGRSAWCTDDLADALALADHHHGYSPALGTFSARGRAATLQRLGDIPRLVAWLTRPTERPRRQESPVLEADGG